MMLRACCSASPDARARVIDGIARHSETHPRGEKVPAVRGRAEEGGAHMRTRSVHTTRARKRGGRVVRPMALVACAMVLIAGCDWPVFRYGPARTGYNPTEREINVANVSGLTEEFTAAAGNSVLSSPAVANGIVYFTSEDTHLYAVDADGDSGCSGEPRTCTPLWTAALGQGSRSSPAVANGMVYVTSDDGTLSAFDADGVTSCSGVPTTCTPLWTAHIGNDNFPSPAIVDGVLYVAASGIPDGNAILAAFDAAGTTGCGGSPKTCTPLWTADLGSDLTLTSPAVANGTVYMATADGLLMAFDAAGNAACSGVPKACAPIWTAPLIGPTFSSAAVANGTVFISTLSAKLEAFDAAGSTACSGTPKVCSPLWTATLGGASDSSPAVRRRRRLRRCKRRQALCVRRIGEHRMHRCTEDLYATLDCPNDGGYAR